MGIQVLDTGVFGGIILGCITGAVFNKYSNKQFPIALSMFSARSLPVPDHDHHLLDHGRGLLHRLASGSGRHPPSPALLRSRATSASLFTACSTSCSFPPVCTTSSTPLFQFSDVGGTLTLGDQVIAGAYPIRVAEMAMTASPSPIARISIATPFNNLWPYIGIGLAFIFTAYKQNKDKTKAVIILLIITAVLSASPSPWTSSFVFAAPVLFVVHSVLFRHLPGAAQGPLRAAFD